MRSEKEKEARRNIDRKRNLEYQNWAVSNPNVINTCNMCSLQKKTSEFVAHFQFRNRCKKCHRDKAKSYRSRNKWSCRETRIRGGVRAAQFIKSLKEGATCSSCSNSYPPHVLDFHHVSDKLWTVSKLYGKSKDRILAEVSKCVLICANCHRDETQAKAAEFGSKEPPKLRPSIVETPMARGCPKKTCASCDKEKHIENFTALKTGYVHSYCRSCLREKNKGYARNRKRRPGPELVKTIKSITPCQDCGTSFSPWVMDMDHFGKEKGGNINKIQTRSMEALQMELSLCDVVCVNCHRDRTYSWRKTSVRCACGLKPRSASEKSKHDAACPFKEKVEEMTDDERKSFLAAVSTRREDPSMVKHFLNKNHYAGFGRAASATYVTSHHGTTVAVTKFSPPVRKEVATSLGWAHDEVLELDRFCIAPRWQVKNLASRAMAQALKLAGADFPAVAVLVSFADSDQGHTGTVYEATNWNFVGTTSTSYTYVNEHGKETNKKRIYDRARLLGIRERELAEQLGLRKMKTGVKKKFTYELK